jgi:ATP-binding cassette subfamily B protein
MKTIKLFSKWIGKQWFVYVFSLVLLVLLNYVRSLIPVLISQTVYILDPKVLEIDRLLLKDSPIPSYLNFFFVNKGQLDMLINAAITVMLIILARDILNFIFDILNNYVSETVGQKVQVLFYNKVQDLPYSYLNRSETGDLIQRATQDITKFKRFISQSLTGMLTSLLLVGFYFYQILRIDWLYALISIIMVPLLAGSSFFYFFVMSKHFEEVEKIEGQIHTVAQENLTNIRVVKSFNNELFEMERFAKELNKYVDKWKVLSKGLSYFWAVTDLIVMVQIVVCFLFIPFFLNRGLNTSQIVLAITCTMNLSWPARNFGRQISEMTKTDIATSRILEIIEMQDEYNVDGTLKPNIQGDIRFDNVCFKFPDSDEYLLKDISFTIKKGQTIALMGRTGKGKTTLVSLINRLLESSSGDIFIDNVNIKDIEKKFLRENVGIVLQEPFLYSATIEENISALLDESSEATVQRAARIANVDKDIKQFTKGYSTLVGERGVTLSGGQKQRIAIARILTNQKPILIFDDSLSAVDTETDKKIRKSLKEYNQDNTVIIITHRITTTMNCDNILILDEGKIIDQGTHDELIQREGLYKRIWDIQKVIQE